MKRLSYILLSGLMLILSACEKDTESANFAPVVTTGTASNIYRMGATLSGSITLTETNTAQSYGILLSSFESMAEPTEYPVKDGSSNYNVLVQGLESGETYYYCAYASSGYSTAKSQIKSFTTTNSNAPVFNEVILQSKDEKSCTISVEILDEGGSDLLISGFVLGESGKGDPTATNNIKIQNVEPQGSKISATFSGLEPNKTYLVRAYGINASGTGYSNSVSVTTNTATVPFLSDITRVDSTEVSVTVKASVLDAGLGEVTKYGFCYSSESKEPTTAHLVVENVAGDSKNFSALIDGLKPETTYYIRAYAINEKGTGYSETYIYSSKQTTNEGFGAVDLGLSVLWANFNLGATSPEDYGDYYAYGEIFPKDTYTEANWIKPGVLYLPAENDAATQQLGEDWRMPTKAEVTELLTECSWELITIGEQYVYKVTGKTGNFIILPLTGSWDEDPAERFENYEARYRTSEAFLETSTESVDDPSTIVLELQKNFADTEVDYAGGWKGHPIRAVKGERKQEQGVNKLLLNMVESYDEGGWGYSKTYSFTYDSDGKIENIICDHSNGSDYSFQMSFSYFQNDPTIEVIYTTPGTYSSEDNFTLDITLNDEGYIKSAIQQFSSGSAIWQYDYNDNGQLIKMNRSEGYEIWELIYDDNNDAVNSYVSYEDASEGEEEVDTITYSSLENKSNLAFHETLYGIDIDEMDDLSLIGLLGKPSKHLPIKRTNHYGLFVFEWEMDMDGYPTKLWVVEDGANYSEYTFTWSNASR